MLGKLQTVQFRGFSTKLKAGSTNSKPDPDGKRRGVKTFEGHEVQDNDIVARQLGFKWHPGKMMGRGKDHTLHAKEEGKVIFTKEENVVRRQKTYASIIPQENPNRRFPKPPPFCFHPELFPELAESNPAPTNFQVKKSHGSSMKGKKRKIPKGPKNRQPLMVSVAKDWQSVKVNMTQEQFKEHKGTMYGVEGGYRKEEFDEEAKELGEKGAILFKRETQSLV